MGPTKTPRKNAQIKSPQAMIADLARAIVMCGTVDHTPTFWDVLCEALLIKVLPAGPEAALAKISSMRLAPQEHSADLAWLPSVPIIVSCVLAQAESALAAHITRLKTLVPKRPTQERYRARRERYPSSYE